MRNLIVPVLSFLASSLLTPSIRAFAIRRRIGDYPSERKVHQHFIPRLGGMAIIGGFVVGIVAILFFAKLPQAGPVFLPLLLLALTSIVALGIVDDVRGVGSLGKLIVQSAAAVGVVAAGFRIDVLSLPLFGVIDLGLWGVPLTFLWLVGITNAVNLLDGLDGLACGVSAIVASSLVIIGAYVGDELVVIAGVSLIAACMGFLRYNFHPASIFMGDTGSLFLGFLLACISLRVLQHQSAEVQPISLLVVVVALGVPIVDTSVAFIRRIKKGMHPLKPDKEHIHHRLMDLGLTHRQTVVTIYAISLFNGLVAVLLVVLDSLYATALLTIVLMSAVFSIRRLGYIEEMRLARQNEKPPIQPLSVARIIDRTVLVMGDMGSIVGAFLLTYWFRFHSGLVWAGGYVPLETYIISPAMFLLMVMWLTLFLLGGLYEIPWDMSRIDYGLAILKAVGIGTLFLFIATFDPAAMSWGGRLATLFHGVSIAMLVLFTRMFIVGIERKYEILGFRRRNTIVVGTSSAAAELVEEIRNRPGLKYHIKGFVDNRVETETFLGLPVLGSTHDIPDVVRKYNIEEILVVTTYDREELLEIAARCNGMVPSIKVMPEGFGMFGGFKTEEILGHPLIRLYPTNLKAWQRLVKRMMDVTMSMFVLIPFLPAWILICLLIVIDSPGPIFFAQERVGKRGRLFKLYKFRSMVDDAEKETGPVWAAPSDKRVTRVGSVLRRFRIDEIPQFINVLKGEMSLVGPRPERSFFVDNLKKEIGLYTRRLLVRPGITGWAQVKLKYDTSVDDVRMKVKYDLYYLENMSITLDIKILFRTLLVALTGKGTH
ncbi:MAG: exopolysaccharide biosynthesis polyprenyl glycosylphosphotransferase [Bacteroidota bacterium]